MRSGTSCAATAALTMTCSKPIEPWATSNSTPYKSSHADFESRFCRSSTDVATPNRRMNGISGHHVLPAD